MKLKIYSVRDRATVQYGNPMFLINRGHAIRSFADEVNKGEGDSMIRRHPEDFDLYELGEFDTGTGLFETGVPEQIAVGKDLAVKV